MSLSWFLALQAVGTTAPAGGVVPSDFDLARHRSSQAEAGCGPAQDGEIVVCGRRRGQGDYPMAEMERRYARDPIRAEARLFGNVQGSAVLEAGPGDRGVQSNRVMLRIRTPF